MLQDVAGFGEFRPLANCEKNEADSSSSQAQTAKAMLNSF